MVWYDKIQHPWLLIFAWFENNGQELHCCSVSSKPSDALKRCPRNQYSNFLLLLHWLEKENSPLSDTKVPYLEVFSLFIYLFLTGKYC